MINRVLTDTKQLDELAERSRRVRRTLEQEWYLNLAFYQGQQWVTWAADRLHQVRLADWATRFTDNRIIGIVRSEIARFMRIKPEFNCVPTSGEDADVEVAVLGDMVLRYLWDELDLQRKLHDALLWARVCCAGFWRITYDKHAGRRTLIVAGPDGPYRGPDGGLVQWDEELARKIQEQGGEARPMVLAEGDISVEVISPFELLPDPLAKTIEDAEWVIEERVHTVDWVRSRYNIPKERITPNAESTPGLVEARLAGYPSSEKDGVIVRELWMRPGPDYPQGRRVTWIDGTVLEDGPNPYLDLPYVMFPAIPVPGRFWPRSIVSDLRPAQAELNKTRSQIRDNAARIANPPLLLARQSVDQQYRGLPGEVVQWNAAMGDVAAPRFLQPPEMPGYVQAELDRMERTLQEISGQHEVSRGQVPPGVTAASAINLLQEQDDTRFEGELRLMEHALSRAGEMILKLAARYYTDERVGRIAGDEGGWETFSFTGAELQKIQRVRVMAGAGMPHSKAARQAAMQDLLNLVLQYGVQVDQRDLRRFLRNFEVGGLENLFATLTVDERQIRDENQLLLRGQPLEINTFDDDQLHLQGHQEFQKTRTYRRAVRLNPQVAEVFDDHVRQHRERLLAAQNAMMQQQPSAEEGTLPNNAAEGNSPAA